jgi:carbon monoxide dehydrogenase subunit G
LLTDDDGTDVTDTRDVHPRGVRELAEFPIRQTPTSRWLGHDTPRWQGRGWAGGGRPGTGGITVELEVSREVGASAERVWAILTDLQEAPRVLSAVERVERLDDGDGFGVGTRWRETRVVFGRASTEELEVTAVDAGHGYATTAERGGTRYASVLEIEPLDPDRCRLSMTFRAASSTSAGRLVAATLGRLFHAATRRMLQRDLDDIAAHAETTSDG